ncbi:MAG TPA: glucuronate isomerase [Actinomycetaceae bacterium]|nr:glucuronate isomerase [Actinomycetaceae bacterium]
MQLSVDPDRLLPSDPAQRAVARELYTAVADLPIISPHGHVPAQWFAENARFPDPTALLLTPDHYINRVLHSHGVPLERLGVGQSDFSEADARAAFATFCRHWKEFRGTPMKYWFEDQLAGVFGIDLVPSAETADELYDRIDALLATEEFRARALHDRFGIEFIATTDDPCDDLRYHRQIAEESWDATVVPTFRPDKYLEVARPEWVADVDRLAEVSGVDTGDYAGWVGAMEARRSYFTEHGAVSADHAHLDIGMLALDPAESEQLYAQARAGSISAADAVRLRRGMLFEQARMAAEDGLVMTLHPGGLRNHHTATFERFGPDVGADFPVRTEFVQPLQPGLDAFGTNPNFQLVLFTMDETTFSREIGPLASFYPSVFAGAPWWFLDTPDGVTHYREAVTESCGFGKTSGMIDDTRALLSIPARHDMARRLDSGYLARLVTEHRLTMDEALETAHDLVVRQPRRTFKLNGKDDQ